MRRIHKGLVVAGLDGRARGRRLRIGPAPARPRRPPRLAARRAPSPSAPPSTSKGGTRPTSPATRAGPPRRSGTSSCKSDANGKATPDVADTFEVTEQQQDVQSAHPGGSEVLDGTPVDSAAVKASFEYVTKNGGATVRLQGHQDRHPGRAEHLHHLAGAAGARHGEQGLRARRSRPRAWLDGRKFDQPVGSGPYVLDAAKLDHRLRLHVHQEREPLGRGELPVQEPRGQGHHAATPLRSPH